MSICFVISSALVQAVRSLRPDSRSWFAQFRRKMQIVLRAVIDDLAVLAPVLA